MTRCEKCDKVSKDLHEDDSSGHSLWVCSECLNPVIKNKGSGTRTTRIFTPKKGGVFLS